MPAAAPPVSFEQWLETADLTDMQRRFAGNANEVERLEAAVAKVKAEQTLMEPLILDGMVEIDEQHRRINGRTIAIHRQLWASAMASKGGKEAAAKLLVEVGLDDLVTDTYNTNTLSALFRNWDKAEQDKTLTEDDRKTRERLLSVFNVAEKFTLRATK